MEGMQASPTVHISTSHQRMTCEGFFYLKRQVKGKRKGRKSPLTAIPLKCYPQGKSIWLQRCLDTLLLTAFTQTCLVKAGQYFRCSFESVEQNSLSKRKFKFAAVHIRLQVMAQTTHSTSLSNYLNLEMMKKQRRE